MMPPLPTEFAGMERFAARKAIVAKLDELGLWPRSRITCCSSLTAIAVACPSSRC